MFIKFLIFLKKIFDNHKKKFYFLKKFGQKYKFDIVYENIYTRASKYEKENKKFIAKEKNLLFSGSHNCDIRTLEKSLSEFSNEKLLIETGKSFRTGNEFLTAYFLESFKRYQQQKNLKFDENINEVAILLNNANELLSYISQKKSVGKNLVELLTSDEHHSLILTIIFIINSKKLSEYKDLKHLEYFASSIILDGRTNHRLTNKFRLAQMFLENHSKLNKYDKRSSLISSLSYIIKPLSSTKHQLGGLNLFEGVFNPKKTEKKIKSSLTHYNNNDLKYYYLDKIRRAKIGVFLFSSLPKSASIFVFSSLCSGLKIPPVGGIQAGAFPNFSLCQEGLIWMLETRGVSHTHLSASKTNLIEISRFNINKMLVHIRDPRQTLISWQSWMLNATKYDRFQFLHYGLPKDYYRYNFESQINWLIENWLPKICKWLNEWMEAKNNKFFTTKLYFSRFEDLKKNQNLFFKNILKFLEIEKKLFIFPSKPKYVGDRNFRDGKIDSWKTVLNKSQVAKVRKIVKKELLVFYGYEF